MDTIVIGLPDKCPMDDFNYFACPYWYFNCASCPINQDKKITPDYSGAED